MRAATLATFVALAFAGAALATPTSLGSFEEARQLSSSDAALDARGATRANGRSCTLSTQCTSGYCRRGNCDAKKPNGHVCYKDQGCTSGICSQSTCVASTGRKNGASCSQSTQCSSGYCGYSACRNKADNGQACYKDAGCKSNVCGSNGKCRTAGSSTKAPTSTTTTVSKTSSSTTSATATNTNSGVGAGNIADFSKGDLGDWTANPADKVTVVADSASPGGYVARLAISDNVPTAMEISGLGPVASTSQSKLQRRDDHYLLEVLMEYKVNTFDVTGQPTYNDDGDRIWPGCYLNLGINGVNTGGNTLYTGNHDDIDIGKWHLVSCGAVQSSAPGGIPAFSSVNYSVRCKDVTAIVDIRNITRTTRYLGSDP
ncbi:unnamed protein product [Parajaminaea phylloscopi]